jgi:hypothetical protein
MNIKTHLSLKLFKYDVFSGMVQTYTTLWNDADIFQGGKCLEGHPLVKETLPPHDKLVDKLKIVIGTWFPYASY